MLRNNVTVMTLSTHCPRNGASAANTFSALASQQMEAAGAPCTASCRPHFGVPCAHYVWSLAANTDGVHCKLPGNSALIGDFYYKQNVF
jgi:hypothetical protein